MNNKSNLLQLLKKYRIPANDRDQILNTVRILGPGPEVEKYAVRIHTMKRQGQRNTLDQKAWDSLARIPLQPSKMAKTAKLHCKALQATGLPLRQAAEVVARVYMGKIQERRIKELESNRAIRCHTIAMNLKCRTASQ